MSLRNATANWSGYNHQGKVGLLVALRKIDALNGLNLNQYRLELETQEDAKLMQGSTVIEVHQVKAYVNSTTIGSYTDALGSFEACTGQNCLHTICEITNWSNLTAAQNKHNVSRYAYSLTKDYCELHEIDNYIVSVMQSILNSVGHPEKDNPAYCHLAFQEYLALLDERIRVEHQTGGKATYNVSFSLAEIFGFLVSLPTRRNAVVCGIRKKIYDKYVDFVKQLEDGHYATMSADHEVFVTNIVKQIALLNDRQLEDFLNQIFPASTQGKTLGALSTTDDFFIGKDFASTFLYTLISIENTKLILEASGFPHYKAGLNYLLTALQHSEVDIHIITRQILENEKLNTARYETDFIINEQLSGKLIGKAPKIINRNSGLMAEKDLEFINRVDAVNKLN